MTKEKRGEGVKTRKRKEVRVKKEGSESEEGTEERREQETESFSCLIGGTERGRRSGGKEEEV